jgi:hypothetical protein
VNPPPTQIHDSNLSLTDRSPNPQSKKVAKMENDKGELVDLYVVPQCGLPMLEIPLEA